MSLEIPSARRWIGESVVKNRSARAIKSEVVKSQLDDLIKGIGDKAVRELMAAIDQHLRIAVSSPALTSSIGLEHAKKQNAEASDQNLLAKSRSLLEQSIRLSVRAEVKLSHPAD